MKHVFVLCHYGVLSIPGFFEQFYKFVGHFKIEQTMDESYRQVFQVWFYTDKVEIKEGEIRQVDILATKNEDGSLTFRIKKI